MALNQIRPVVTGGFPVIKIGRALIGPRNQRGRASSWHNFLAVAPERWLDPSSAA
jgi:hypothetical protein